MRDEKNVPRTSPRNGKPHLEAMINFKFKARSSSHFYDSESFFDSFDVGESLYLFVPEKISSRITLILIYAFEFGDEIIFFDVNIEINDSFN